VDPVTATGYSLFVVGLTSLIGSVGHMRMGNINWRTALVFGIPSIVAVFLTRMFIMPALPDVVMHLGSFTLSKSVFLLLLFAVLMLVASWSMIRKGKNNGDNGEKIQFNYPLILAEGAVVGVITGLVGAGGGFLIIPALVLLARLPMKQAVGTSLIIIAAKSLIGFTGDLGAQHNINWTFLFSFSAVAIVGILLGALLSKRIQETKLKPAFGWFVLVMGVYIIINELFLRTGGAH